MERCRTEASDEDLLDSVSRGASGALAVLFERYAALVGSIGRRILRDTGEAEDLTQELFLFLQRKSRLFDRSKSSARSWIVQMAYQRAIDRRRSLAARGFYKREELQSGAGNLVAIPTGWGDRTRDIVFGRGGLEKAMDALSDDQRETLRLFFFEGYTLTEISEKLAQPVGNVRHHYYRALDKLRKKMFPGDKR